MVLQPRHLLLMSRRLVRPLYAEFPLAQYVPADLRFPLIKPRRGAKSWNEGRAVLGALQAALDMQGATDDHVAPASTDELVAPKQTGFDDSKADLLPHNTWQGRDISFMRSNEHGRERDGLWNTEGLNGAALRIVSGDEKAAKCELAAQVCSLYENGHQV